MYAYVADKAGREVDSRELAYWRKHPNLHGWMEQLWRNKKYSVQPTDASAPVESDSDMFNGVELELTWADIDALEQAVTHRQLPATTGFFFGRDADEEYYQDDLPFIKAARTELFMGLKVFYNSSW